MSDSCSTNFIYIHRKDSQVSHEPRKYSILKGTLHVNVSKNPHMEKWAPSSGVDLWDSFTGEWLQTD